MQHINLEQASNRYLGIQYINYRDMKIVWVANRQNSLMDSSGVPSINGEEIVWQSFDFPSDTILPGMKLGLFDTSQDSIRIWIGMNPSGQIDMFIVGLDGSSALWSQSSCDDEEE
nr:g-type lectin s-receptor-like serine/threonine-protein kinase [Quercus suber]